MTKKNTLYPFTISVVTILLFICSCRREKTTWDTELQAPLINTELSIKNLLKSDNLTTATDSSLKLVFENSLVDLEVGDVFSMEDTVVEFGSSLQTLKLSDDSSEVSVSLGQIINTTPFGAFISALNGTSITIPALTNIVVPGISIDNSDLFESIDIETGKMIITIENNLPVEAVNIDLEIRNSVATGGAIIAATSFTSIPANTTVSKEIPLDGKSVSAELVAQITSLSTLASPGPVLLDTSNTIVTQIKITQIKPSKARAIWPAQNLIDTTRLYKIPKSEGILMKEMLVKEGNLEIEVFSSMQDSMYITYRIPNLIKDGNSFSITSVIAPAPAGGITSIKRSYSLSNYDFIFNGFGIEKTVGTDLNKNSIVDPDTINSYVQNTQVRMQYTGKMVTLSKQDTIYIKARITEITPISAKGYMGQELIDVGPASIDFSVLKNYVSGKIALEDVKMNLSVDNNIGATAKLNIINLDGFNSINNSTVNLSGSGVSIPYSIKAATESVNPTNPVTTAATEISLNSGNSNVNDFISNLPTSISYNIQALLNDTFATPPSVSEVINNPPNFIYSGKGFSAKLNVEIPLSMVAESLVLVDTLNFTYQGDLTDANAAYFSVLAENNFAYDASFSLILMNESNTELDTLLSNGFIKRGLTDPVTGKIIESTTSKLGFTVSKDKMTSVMASTKIKAYIKLHSYNLNDSNKKFNKIYSSDGFKLKLIGSSKFNVKL